MYDVRSSVALATSVWLKHHRSRGTTTMAPLILTVDLDGTLVGDVSHLVAEYELVDAVVKRGGKLRFDKARLVKQLRDGLLRPHVASFMHYIRDNLPSRVELFVYTAGSKRWADMMVSAIEKVVGVTFNRPVLSRDQCVIVDNCLQKSLLRVSHIIYSRLQRKYGLMSPRQVADRTILIDNTPGILLSDKGLVHCPTYRFTAFHDVFAAVTRDVFLAYPAEVHSVLYKHALLQQCPPRSYWEGAAQAYDRFARHLAAHQHINEQAQHDRFFLRLESIFRQHADRFGELPAASVASLISRALPRDTHLI
jgi:hypothetical protein